MSNHSDIVYVVQLADGFHVVCECKGVSQKNSVSPVIPHEGAALFAANQMAGRLGARFEPSVRVQQ